MVVRDRSHSLRKEQGFLRIARSESGRTHAHRRTVAKTVIRLRIVAEHPLMEPSAIPAVRIMPPDVLHTAHCVLAEQCAERLHTVAVLGHIRRCSLRLHDRLCHSERHDAVIRCKTALAKEIKLLAAVIVELEPRANDIANDCSDHMPS